MAKDRLSGKLAVILHADVAGSTQLVQQNEQLAHERIQIAFRRFSDTITKYHGRVQELRGDALLAEFERASDAVSAALAFQSDHQDDLAKLNDDIRPNIRVGIALGEVVIADSTVTGAGVVLAQRVEQLAESGGLCITSAIHEALPNRMPFSFASLGEQTLKGFDEPVRVYRAQLSTGEEVPLPQQKSQRPVSPNNGRQRVAIAVAVMLIAGGIAFWSKYSLPQEEPALVERMAFPLPDKPSIAVLPFANMSSDPEQDYFADGITEDLITDLSKLPELFVISRNSSFTYKGREVKGGLVAEELGVNYLLEGSVRRFGTEVRINAQLIDALGGGHVWAERYDGSLVDVFALQDQIVGKIISALELRLTTRESTQLKRVQTEMPLAYDYYLRGMQHYQKATPKHYAKSLEQFNKAVELDPGFSHAYAALASVYMKSYRLKFYTVLKLEAFMAWNKVEENLPKAMAKPNSLAFQVASYFDLEKRQFDTAIEHANKAVALNPNDAEARSTLAFVEIMNGNPEQALVTVNMARRLDPHNEYYYAFLQGLAEFGLADHQSAVKSFERALELNPVLWTEGGDASCAPSAPLIAAYYYIGNKDAARELIQKEKIGCPTNRIMFSWPFRESRDSERLSVGLRGAGLS